MKKVVLRNSVRGSSSSSSTGNGQNQSSSRSQSSNNNNNNVRWASCQKNHAVSTGGHSLDGCTRFIPGSGTNAVYTCASCGCHRNFHKKEES